MRTSLTSRLGTPPAGRILALLLALLLVAAACGGGGDDDDGTAGGEPQEETGDPVRGGVITIAQTSDVPSIDPRKSGSITVHSRIGMAYSCLLEPETGPDIPYNETRWKGDLAERGEIADDGMTYTFHLWILPKEAVDGLINLDEQAIGTGPFILEKRQQNVEMVYRRNPDYHEEGKPYLDRIRLPTMVDNTARLNAFHGGELDAAAPSPEELPGLERAIPGLDVRATVSSLAMLYLDAADPLLSGLRVRKAISMAIDREGIIEQIRGGGELAAPSPPGWARGRCPRTSGPSCCPTTRSGPRSCWPRPATPTGSRSACS